jgi:hypothetical protein
MTLEKGGDSGIAVARLKLELQSPKTGTSSGSCETGRAPRGPSQWSNNKDRQLCCELLAIL